MDTLEAYGIKDVTPGNSVGSTERVRGVFTPERSILALWVGNQIRGSLIDAKYSGKKIGGQYQYENSEGIFWLDEVSYN